MLIINKFKIIFVLNLPRIDTLYSIVIQTEIASSKICVLPDTFIRIIIVAIEPKQL